MEAATVFEAFEKKGLGQIQTQGVFIAYKPSVQNNSILTMGLLGKFYRDLNDCFVVFVVNLFFHSQS